MWTRNVDSAVVAAAAMGPDLGTGEYHTPYPIHYIHCTYFLESNTRSKVSLGKQ